MKRARVTGLALANWKGVFFERYLFDRHVTALEGANGAGKTTVMIAAYVVLLPDMSRLRFTNLGETAATGGDRGVWGRLGESGRPAYSALDFELADGRRVIAGVQLVRKGEPSVELNPFVVSELDPGVRLSDLFLVSSAEHDEIPTFEQLAENVKRASARLTQYQTTKDYFAALFELGIAPLRLASDEERNKLNEVLRTSMTGGISRALTSELRSFLLREESGLFDTLSRMRKNLDACRRTRTEVLQARALEHEISGIFEAGNGMFGAAYGAARARVDECAAKGHVIAAQIARLERDAAELEAELGRGSALEDAHAERRRATQAELGAALEQLRVAQQAAALEEQLRGVRAELVERERDAARAQTERDAGLELRQNRKLERDRAREAYERAARGLADSKSGLDELHRNAAAERQLARQLELARSLLAEPSFALEQVSERRARVADRLAELDRAAVESDRERQRTSLRRRDYQRALAALLAIRPEPSAADAHEQARLVLREYDELALSASRSAELAQAYEQASALAARQARTRERARRLGLEAATSAHAVRQEHQRVEEAARRLEAEATERRSGASAALARSEAARAEAARVAAERPRWEAFALRRRRLQEASGSFLGTEADFNALLTKLVAEREKVRAELGDHARRREQAKAEASALLASGNHLDPELVTLRDELDGELLANRFEDLALEEAATLEAELGPLAQAILVTDAEQAARELAGRPRRLNSVFLVSEGALGLRAAGATRQGDDLLVRESYGVRVTRRPQRPVLGRLARKRRIEELEESALASERALEELEQRAGTLDGMLRECQSLAGEVARFGSEPPAANAELEERVAAASAEAEALARAAAEAGDAVSALRLRASELTSLLEEAFLLEAPDYAQRAEALATQLQAARRAQAECERTARSRAELAELLDALRGGDPEREVDADAEAQRAALLAERDRSYRAGLALDELAALAAHGRFPDAERLLAERAALLPALSAQHEAAREAEERAQAALDEAELAWEQLVKRYSEADAARAAVQAHVARLQHEHDALAKSSLSSASQETISARITELSASLAELEAEERELSAQRGARAERRQQLTAKLGELARERARASAELVPFQQVLAELERAADSLQHAASFEPRAASRTESRAAALAAEASGKLDLLLGRLSTARGGAELITRLREELGELRAEPGCCVRLWTAVRAWLSERVPAQIATVEEPLLALERLRAQLSVLEQRLGRQELDLRGASEDVARGIEVGIRRAKAQVRRLNQTLAGIAFGSIAGIRVQLKRVERMDQVLAALREGAAQELLFQSNLPIEEAFDEIFKRFAGGKTGAQKLLDYREYLELTVEIQRRATAEWEPANPARLSTGEAIGVGATLMMVVLTEWERDANLLRGQKSGGTLRFLFLDEANRLSQDNLGVLFELCKTLDLQLLIAAPEVARAEGNTTYRLVRRVTDSGQEEVIVTGRRSTSRAQPELVEEPPAPEPPPAGQLDLLS